MVSALRSGSERPFAEVLCPRCGGGRCGKGAPGQAVALRRGGRRRAPTALRCSVWWPRRGTHCAPCRRSVQTTATSQTTMRAARAAPRPVLLGASEARLRLPGRAFAEPLRVFVMQAPTGDRRGGRCPLEAMSGATRSTAPGSARVSALRELACRGCLNGATAGRAVSSAARPWREHRSAVGPQGRPLQHEPTAGSACRDAPAPHESRAGLQALPTAPAHPSGNIPVSSPGPARCSPVASCSTAKTCTTGCASSAT